MSIAVFFFVIVIVKILDLTLLIFIIKESKIVSSSH